MGVDSRCSAIRQMAEAASREAGGIIEGQVVAIHLKRSKMRVLGSPCPPKRRALSLAD